jgi:acetamidase/formamidase
VIRLSKQYRVFAFSRGAAPALRVPAGTTLELETADYFDDQVQVPDDVLAEVDEERINPATGPVYVEEAGQGDVLSVLVERIDIGDQGVMAVGPDFGVLGEWFGEQVSRIVPIAGGAETATRDMAALLTGRLDLTADVATMLMSAGGDLQVSQIVDPLRTARFALSKPTIAGLGRNLV